MYSAPFKPQQRRGNQAPNWAADYSNQMILIPMKLELRTSSQTLEAYFLKVIKYGHDVNENSNMENTKLYNTEWILNTIVPK